MATATKERKKDKAAPAKKAASFPFPEFHLYVDPEAHPEWPEAFRKQLRAATNADEPTTLGALTLCVHPPMTAEQAKESLGWEEHEKKVRGALFQDNYDRWVVLSNNRNNRRFRINHAEKFAQKVLFREMRLNFETHLRGAQGSVISYQHRRTGLVLAHQRWEGALNEEIWKEKYWKDGPPTLECLEVRGVGEDEATLASVDDVLPSTLADVLYKDGYFKKSETDADRDRMTRLLSGAVQWLWDFVGADGEGSFLDCKTNTGQLAFLERHKRLADALVFIEQVGKPTEADLKKGLKHHRVAGVSGIGKPCEPGVHPSQAAALLYLMAARDTDPAKYRRPGVAPSEKNISWGEGDKNWTKACEFWAHFAAQTGGFRQVRQALVALMDKESLQFKANEKEALICKAWQRFYNNQRFTEQNLELKRDDDAALDADDMPDFRGIHRVLHPEDERARQAAADKAKESQPAPGEVPPAKDEAAAEEERKKKRAEQKKKLLKNRAEKNGDHAEKNGAPAAPEAKEPEKVKELTFVQKLARDKESVGGPDVVVLYSHGGEVSAWAEDARTLHRVLHLDRKSDNSVGGVVKAGFRLDDLDTNRAKLEAQGLKVAVLEYLPA